jgi:hypothetical protein
MEYQITIGIQAESQPKAVEIAKALTDIKNVLSETDLLELAKLLKSKPGLVKTAKKFLS